MNTNVEYCQVKCNWAPVEGTSIAQVTIYQQENEEEGQSHGNPSPSGCTLTSNHEEEPCTVSISTRPPQYNFLLAAIDVLCTARHVEVHGSDGAYIETVRGMVVQDSPAGKLSLLQHTFSQPQSACSIKLCSLPTPGTVWIHSLYITIQPTPFQPASPMNSIMGPSIDLDKVRSLMEGTQVAEGAQQLMAAMESRQKSVAGNPGDVGSLGAMMQMFSQMAMSSAMKGQGQQQGSKGQGHLSENQGQRAGASSDKCQEEAETETEVEDKGLNENIEGKSNYVENRLENSVHDQSENSTKCDKSSNHAQPSDTIGDYGALLTIFRQELSAMETRICERLERSVSEAEGRIQQRIDHLLSQRHSHIELD